MELVPEGRTLSVTQYSARLRTRLSVLRNLAGQTKGGPSLWEGAEGPGPTLLSPPLSRDPGTICSRQGRSGEVGSPFCSVFASSHL